MWYRILMIEGDLLAVVRRLPMALFVVAVPLFLICVSVTWAVNDIRLYEHGFDTYNVPLVTGIERGDLLTAAREIRGYFNSTNEPLDVRTKIYGEERDLFSQREVMHMRDVKRLIWGLYAMGATTGLYLMGFVGLGITLKRSAIGAATARGVAWGGGLTVGLLIILGLLSVVGFDRLFLFFHQVSFSNDFWKLDSRNDFLVMMFPQSFWFDATIFVALATVGQATTLLGVVGALEFFRRWHERRRQRPVAEHPA